MLPNSPLREFRLLTTRVVVRVRRSHTPHDILVVSTDL